MSHRTGCGRLLAGRVFVVGVTLGAAACGSSRDAQSALRESPRTDTSGPHAWSRSTPTGATVRIRVVGGELRAGATAFALSIDPTPPPDAAIALDLASPTMPLHGVTRFIARRTAPGEYAARVDVPMEGRWALYVNIASDVDTASVAFDALPARGTNASPRAGDAHRVHGE